MSAEAKVLETELSTLLGKSLVQVHTRHQIHTYTYMYICVYVIYIHIYVHIYTYNIYIYAYIYIYIYKISIHICTCIYVYTLVRTHPQAGGKLQVLDRLLTISLSEGSRMLIFSQWTLTLDVLVEFCETRFGPEGVGYLRLDGVLYVCVCL